MSGQRVSREPCKHTCSTIAEIQRLLDEVRTANDLLRAWGNDEADARDRAERGGLRVVAVALRLDDEGAQFLVMPPPARHCDLLRVAHSLAPQMILTDMDRQGFILSDGHFCCRKAAGQIAISAGQIVALTYPPLLYSEDLW